MSDCFYLLPLTLSLWIVFLSFVKPTTVPPTQCEHNLMDLYGANLDVFTALSQPWTINGQISPSFSKTQACGTNIIGGLNGFTTSDSYERTYSGLSSHDMISYSIRVLVFDGWLAGDTITLQMDGVSILSWQPYNTLLAEGTPLCGVSNLNDCTASFFVGKLNHNTTTLTIKFTSNVISGSTTASFGIRAIRASLYHKTPTETQGSCIKTQVILPPLGCVCPNNLVEDPLNIGQCVSCFSGCSQCYGTGDDKCYSCKLGYSFNGKKCVSCTPNCNLCTGPNPNECVYCTSSYILYWDHTCRQTLCTFPYIQETTGDLKACKTPCQPNGYLVWDNSCSNVCNYPYIERIEGDAKFCDFPCNSVANKFLLWDNSCSSTCNFYATQINGYNFCDACQPNYFMYPNGTCLPTCLFPRKQRIQGRSTFCDNPCSDPLMYYYPKNGKCKPVCNYPYKIQDTVFCVLELTEEDTDQTNVLGNALGIINQITGPAASVSALLSGGDPTAFCFTALSDMLQYLRYLKIRYPPKLQNLLDQESDPLYQIIPNISQKITEQLPHATLPEKFEEYELASSFLINFWQPSIHFMIAIISVLISVILVLFTKSCCKSVHSFVLNVKKTLKWNFTFMLWLSYSDIIVMSTSFEARTASFQSIFPILSFLLCLVANIISLAIFIKMIIVTKTIWKTRRVNRGLNRQSKLKILKANLSDYNAFFSENEEDSIFQIGFLIIFTLKVHLFYAVIAFLFDHPIVQTLLMTFFSIFMVLYLMITRPLKSKLKVVEFIIQETIILIVNICILTLAFFDITNTDAYEDRKRIGEVVIICDMVFVAFALLFILTHIVISLFSICQKIRVYVRSKKSRTIDNMLQKQPISNSANSLKAQKVLYGSNLSGRLAASYLQNPPVDIQPGRNRSMGRNGSYLDSLPGSEIVLSGHEHESRFIEIKNQGTHLQVEKRNKNRNNSNTSRRNFGPNKDSFKNNSYKEKSTDNLALDFVPKSQRK